MRSRFGTWVRALAAGCGLALSATADAGSFMMSGGDLSYSTSLGYLWANQQWDADRNLSDTTCEREFAYNGHRVEYGLSYYRTLFAGANLGQSSCSPDSQGGLGDIRVGMRGRLDVFRNHRTWEIEATLPTPGASPPTGPRLGCGALGLSGSVAIKEPVVPLLQLGAGAGVQLWEQPLTHQFTADVSAGGAFGRWSPWRWEVGLNGKRPIDTDKGAADTDITDCGTRSQLVRGGARVSFQPTDFVTLDCGISQTLWGVDTARTTGVYCGFSRLWKG